MFPFSHPFKNTGSPDGASHPVQSSPASSTEPLPRKRKSKLPYVMATLVVVAGVIVLVTQLALPFLDFQKSEVKATNHIEYTQRFDANLNDILTCTSDQAQFTVKGDVDATKVGTQDLPVSITEGPFSKEVTVPIQVKDTQPPEISLKAESFTASLGDELKDSDIVKTVADPIDGKLDAVKDEPEARGTIAGEQVFYDKGWYRIDGLASTNEAGSHTMSVIACDRHGNKTSKELKLDVNDPLKDVTLKPKTDVLEYAKKPVDPVSLVTCSDSDTKVEADALDLSSLGKKEVKYKLSKGKSTREITCTFTVRDTKSPVIQLKEPSVSIDKGGSFDPYANVKSVSDEVDGDLSRVEGEQSNNGNGWFTVEGAHDVNKPGKYSLTVIACDKNGNRTKKDYNLEVKEPPAPAAPEVAPTVPEATNTEAPASEQSNAQDYVLNHNTKKFHYPSCRDVKRIKDKNREDVHMSRDEIVGDGFSPCAHCNP